ncbi:ABC transporter-like protein [Leptolyngbya sp. NIES-3755]|nr:ABC transporter-like protein [Leptolyngbya sp. NIES-3755]
MTDSRHGIHLKLEGLRKSFHTQEVLRGIDLEVLPGQFVAIVGRSGCGKSTILRLVSALDSPTDGSILLDGQRSRKLNPDVRIMFQDSRLLPWQRVIDNVEVGLIALKDQASALHKQKAREGLASVGLADRVILIEDGQVGLDVPINLPHPRQRGNPTFAKTVEDLVQRLLGKTKQGYDREKELAAVASEDGLEETRTRLDDLLKQEQS